MKKHHFMRWMRLNLRQRFLVGFGTLALLIAAAGWMEISDSRQLNREFNRVVLISEMHDAVKALEFWIREEIQLMDDLSLLDDKAGLSSLRERFSRSQKGLEAALSDLTATGGKINEMRPQIERLQDEASRFSRDFDIIFRQMYELKGSDSEEAMELRDMVKKAASRAKEMLALLSSVEKGAKELLDDKVSVFHANIKRLQKVTEAGSAILFLLTMAVAVLLFSSVIRPIAMLRQRAEDLAVGDSDLTKQLYVRPVNCSQIMGCDYPECPSYGKVTHCWNEAGSFAEEVKCPKVSSGEYESCQVCECYKSAMVTELDEVCYFMNGFIEKLRQLVEDGIEKSQRVKEINDRLVDQAVEMEEAAVNSKTEADSINSRALVAGESISSVAAAMEEMTATVTEISQNAVRASQVAATASQKAEDTHLVISALAEAARKIGEVSNLIGSIAEQTNLLALNATIEAARAGEAGKGFAVVANEVKELAKQTASSVTEIDQMVSELQGKAEQGAAAADEILSVIREVAEVADNIAAAVEEQTATTNEISESTQRVNGDVGAIVDNSQNIAAASQQALSSAEEVKQVAEELQGLSGDLLAMMSRFKV